MSSLGSLPIDYDSAGDLHVFGGKVPGPVATVRIHRRSLETSLFLNPQLRAGEAYMDGALTVEDGSTVYDFILLFSINRSGLAGHRPEKLRRAASRLLRRWQQANPIGRAAARARHHYDISTDLYRLFLDEDLNYSCAYFHDPDRETLEQAQRNKFIHATSKLGLKPGMTVAEIGCGWGGRTDTGAVPDRSSRAKLVGVAEPWRARVVWTMGCDQARVAGSDGGTP